MSGQRLEQGAVAVMDRPPVAVAQPQVDSRPLGGVSLVKEYAYAASPLGLPRNPRLEAMLVQGKIGAREYNRVKALEVADAEHRRMPNGPQFGQEASQAAVHESTPTVNIGAPRKESSNTKPVTSRPDNFVGPMPSHADNMKASDPPGESNGYRPLQEQVLAARRGEAIISPRIQDPYLTAKILAGEIELEEYRQIREKKLADARSHAPVTDESRADAVRRVQRMLRESLTDGFITPEEYQRESFEALFEGAALIVEGTADDKKAAQHKPSEENVITLLRRTNEPIATVGRYPVIELPTATEQRNGRTAEYATVVTEANPADPDASNRVVDETADSVDPNGGVLLARVSKAQADRLRSRQDGDVIAEADFGQLTGIIWQARPSRPLVHA